MGIFKKKYEVAKLPESKKPPLDTYISDYLTSVLNLSKEAKEGNAKFSSYTALTKMKWMIEPENGEGKRQEKLAYKCDKWGYRSVQDGAKGEKINWCQFSTGEYKINEKNNELEKLYINCDRDKVADISKKLMKAAKKQKLPISFKIAYEDGISDNYHRSEKIVIYTEKSEQKDAIVDILKNIDKKNKNIFNRDRTIPFMPKVEGAEFICSPGKQSKGLYTTFTRMDGLPWTIDNTWNVKMSKVLEEALVYGYEMTKGTYIPFDPAKRELHAADDKIEEYVEDCLFNMDEKQQSQTISYMKKAIFELCEKNNIPIDKELKERYIQEEGLKNSLKENTKTSPTPEMNRIQNKSIDDRGQQR